MKRMLFFILTVTFLILNLNAEIESAGLIVDAVGRLISQAQQGEPVAQYQLGEAYYYGKGLPKDYKEAVKWFRMAAEKGVSAAQCALGKCYKNGEGVPQDYKEALKYFRLSAQTNNPEAQYYLGMMNYAGIGLPVNYKEGVKWFRQSAENGYVEAQANLGFCYYEGSGVSVDVSEAYFWLKLASLRCSDDKKTDYAKAAENVKVELTPEQIDQIENRVRTWLKDHNE
ncbi:MAG: tetratricopeptide repeat protein [Candidatus Cloacimonadaceae bacterium]